MRKSIVTLFLLISFGKLPSTAQTSSCHELLDSLIVKVETDYAGYIHKVKEPGNPMYQDLKKKLKAKSNILGYKDCYDVLETYTGFFKDGHLFIIEFPRENLAQTDSLYHLIKHVTIPENYRDSLAKDMAKDSVEGIWKDAINEQIAILKVRKNLFYGVIQQSDVPK